MKKCNQFEFQLKRLLIDLAVRAHELERGRPPKSWNELVPDFLESVPVDPETGVKLTIHSEKGN